MMKPRLVLASIKGAQVDYFQLGGEIIHINPPSNSPYYRQKNKEMENIASELSAYINDQRSSYPRKAFNDVKLVLYDIYIYICAIKSTKMCAILVSIKYKPRWRWETY